MSTDRSTYFNRKTKADLKTATDPLCGVLFRVRSVFVLSAFFSPFLKKKGEKNEKRICFNKGFGQRIRR